MVICFEEEKQMGIGLGGSVDCGYRWERFRPQKVLGQAIMKELKEKPRGGRVKSFPQVKQNKSWESSGQQDLAPSDTKSLRTTLKLLKTV